MALLGNPFITNVPRQMSNEELAQAIRVDIAGELEEGRQKVKQQQSHSYQQTMQ